MRSRPLTDLYLAAVRRAIARPGEWTDVRVFKTAFNASITGRCLEGGFLRVKPREGERQYRGPAGQKWLATRASVEPRVDDGPDGWLLKIRVPRVAAGGR